jgi:hypothetical protein
MMHSFGAKKLSDARAKHSKTIGVSRIGGWACSFELQHPSLADGVDYFTQIDCSTISELTCPVSKLMTTIAHSKRFHVGKQLAARECIEEPLAMHFRRA